MILSHTPSEVRNDVFDHIEVSFDEAIDPVTFTVDDVAISGPSGSVPATNVGLVSDNTYRVDFPALTVRGNYEAVVGPDIADLDGNLMDQNQDATNGDADIDVYRASLGNIIASTILTSDVTIVEGDATYDGGDICVDGTTVTINGPHGFNSVHLVNGAVLTHSANTGTETHTLDLTVTEQVIVDATSLIDVTGKGYLPGRTTGNTTEGASDSRNGGSYGGLGGDSGGQRGDVYGDYANPDDWGGGGGTQSGGGLVTISADTLQLDGQLLADGSGAAVYAAYIGAGAGGGIRVSVTTLEGGGSIRAKGGDTALETYMNSRGAGGGGRVAVYAADLSGFDIDAITAPGGLSRYGVDGWHGGAGTVYIRDTDEPDGVLVIADGIGETALGLSSDDSVLFSESVLIRAANVRPANMLAALQFEAPLTVLGGTLRAASLTVDSLTITDGGAVHAASLLADTPLNVDGGKLFGSVIRAPAVDAINGSLLSCLEHDNEHLYALDVRVAGHVSIDSTSHIDVSKMGYPGGHPGQMGPFGYAGASYGGLGAHSGQPGSQPNAVYGDYRYPEWGTTSGGGGLVRVTADALTLDGQILADGKKSGGGESGGGVYISVEKLEGIGSISAAGGTARWPYPGAGGGGGRIAVYATDLSEFDVAAITAPGGYYGWLPDVNRGEDGTIHVVEGIPPTFLTSYSPTTAPAAVNHIELTFTRPIDLSSFDIEDLEIRGPLGSITANGISLVEGTTYRIDLPQLSENGTYHFALPSNVLDTRGHHLDENANGIPGEPNDFPSWSIVVDAVPPRVTHHIPAGDIAGTIDHVDVWFSEAIDRTTFFAWSDVEITDPDGQPITVNSIEEVGLNRFRISFPPQTTIGTYHLGIGPDVLDVAGNPLDQDRDGTPGELVDDVYDASFNLVAVDLQISDVVVDPIELYVSFETIPTRLDYDFRAAPGEQDLELAVQSVSSDGTFYLLVYGKHVDGITSYDISAEAAEIILSDVTPRRYGNLAQGTLTISGVGFDAATSVIFVGSDGSE